MKRAERQHLKENELAHSLAAARDFVEGRGKAVGSVIVAIVVIVAVVIGVVVYRNRAASQGQDLLAAAKVALNAPVVPVGAEAGGEQGSLPAAATIGATGSFSTEAAKLNAALPKLKAAVDAYPDSAAGIEARYHYAGALASLGRHQEAVAEFEQVVQRAGSGSLYGRMAALGKARSEPSMSKYCAIASSSISTAISASPRRPSIS